MERFLLFREVNHVSLTKKMKISLISAISGLCNALLGAGGGVLLSLTLSRLDEGDFSDRRDALATSQAAMIPGCIASCIVYGIRGMLDTANFAIFAIPAMLGGAVGGLLMDKIKPRMIGRIFALFVIWSGARMIIG